MRRRFAYLATAVLLVAATPALAAPQDRLFLSPSGEPFRAPPGGPDPFDAWFDRADANHDGSLDRAEFIADAERFFKKLDANGDGVLDGFEINDYETKVVPELIAGAEGPLDEPGEGQRDHDKDRSDAKGRGRKGEAADRGVERLLDEAEPVSGAEFEFNGHVSQDNWIRATKERFDLLDTAKTGKLTREGLKVRLHPGPKPRDGQSN